MNRREFGAACALAGAVAGARTARAEGEPRVIDLWPGKAPGETGDIGPEQYQPPQPNQRVVKRLANVSKPTLSIFRPAKDNDTGASVIIAPGGGYSILAWDLEGTEVAEWLNTLGVTGIVLKYRVPRRMGQPADQPPVGPLQDGQRAVSYVRSHAAKWGLDPTRIGMLGFSAGGHLAASVSNNFDRRAYESVDSADQASCRPDFTVLVYPAYLVKRNSPELSPEIHVTAKTPPAFLVHAHNDPIPVENSVQYYLAMKRANLPSELHVYSRGGHGYGLRPSEDPVSGWPKPCAEWLRVQGYLKAKTSA